MIARLLLSLSAGLGTDAALIWAFGPPLSLAAALCLVGVVGCFLAGYLLVVREEA